MRSESWRRYLTFWRRDVRRDVDDELRFHLEERTADLIASGMPPADAARQARAEFGDVDTVSAGLRDIDQRMLETRARTEWRCSSAPAEAAGWPTRPADTTATYLGCSSSGW